MVRSPSHQFQAAPEGVRKWPPASPSTPLLALDAVAPRHCQAAELRDELNALEEKLPPKTLLDDPNIMQRPGRIADDAVVTLLNSATEKGLQAKKLAALELDMPMTRSMHDASKKVRHWARMACGVDHAVHMLSTRKPGSFDEQQQFVTKLTQELQKFPLPPWLPAVLDTLQNPNAYVAPGGK